MFNPFICKIDGDLSRADAVVLTQLCRNKDVVEFGVGASTIIISQVAKSLISYDTDINWIEKIKSKVDNVEFRLIEKDAKAMDSKGFECDVLFDDGWSVLRAPFLMEFWFYIKEYAILHDSRMTYAGNCVKRFIDAFEKPKEGGLIFGNPNSLPSNLYTGSLESIYWNYLESNMVVMKKRNCTLKYEDWKVVEND